jgi:hypothetical protein
MFGKENSHLEIKIAFFNRRKSGRAFEKLLANYLRSLFARGVLYREGDGVCLGLIRVANAPLCQK